MLKTVDKKILRTGHYGNFSKLGFRKKYNDFAESRLRWDKEIIGFIKESRAKRVLDIGCGNGDLLIKLRKSGFSGELFGVELSPGILKGGIEQNKKENLNIFFEVGDAQNLRFQDNYFDTILAKHMLHHLPNPQKGVDEIHRCLKPNGTLIITLNSEKNKPRFFECERRACKKYGLRTEHGQQLVSVENVKKYLAKFSKTETRIRKGKIRKPELFTKYFDSFKDNYEPEPNKELWEKILKDVKEYVKEETKKRGEFAETGVTGLTKATK